MCINCSFVHNIVLYIILFCSFLYVLFLFLPFLSRVSMLISPNIYHPLSSISRAAAVCYTKFEWNECCRNLKFGGNILPRLARVNDVPLLRRTVKVQCHAGRLIFRFFVSLWLTTRLERRCWQRSLTMWLWGFSTKLHTAAKLILGFSRKCKGTWLFWLNTVFHLSAPA